MLQLFRCHLQALRHLTQKTYLRVEGSLKGHHLQESCLTSPNCVGFLLLQFPQILFLPPFRYSLHSPFGGSRDCPLGALHTISAQYPLRLRNICSQGREPGASGVPSTLLVDMQPCETTFSTHQEVPISGPLRMAVASAKSTFPYPLSLMDSPVPCSLLLGQQHESCPWPGCSPVGSTRAFPHHRHAMHWVA